jgi:hypothetical protein
MANNGMGPCVPFRCSISRYRVPELSFRQPPLKKEEDCLSNEEQLFDKFPNATTNNEKRCSTVFSGGKKDWSQLEFSI